MTFIWPLLGQTYVTRGFSYRSAIYVGGQHAAADIICVGRPTTGALVVAIADGTLTANWYDGQSGHSVNIEHADGWRSGYRHLLNQIWPTGVPIPVKQGQVIGYADSTGNVTGPHLHFDLWNRAKLDATAFRKVGFWAHDPERYLTQHIDQPAPTPEPEESMKQVVWIIHSQDAADQGQYVFIPGQKLRILTNKELRFIQEHTDEYDVKDDTWAGGEITESLR